MKEIVFIDLEAAILTNSLNLTRSRVSSKMAATVSMGAAILLETRDIARPTVDQWPLWSTRLFGLVYMLRELCVERSYTCGVENHVKCVLLA